MLDGRKSENQDLCKWGSIQIGEKPRAMSSSNAPEDPGRYCTYQNDEDLVDIYGRLYNYDAVVDSRNICPEGWHVPTDLEWKSLERRFAPSMNMFEEDATNAIRGKADSLGGKLKAITLWESPIPGLQMSQDSLVYQVGDGWFIKAPESSLPWSLLKKALTDIGGRVLTIIVLPMASVVVYIMTRKGWAG
jgi:hypothetical protein